MVPFLVKKWLKMGITGMRVYWGHRMRKLDPCMILVPGFHIYNHCGTDLTIDKII